MDWPHQTLSSRFLRRIVSKKTAAPAKYRRDLRDTGCSALYLILNKPADVFHMIHSRASGVSFRSPIFFRFFL